MGAPSERLAPPFPRVTLEIFGLSCSSDALKIERDLAALPGVTRAYVNPVTEMAYLHYDPDRIDVASLIEAVRRAGFDAAMHRCSPL